MSSQEVPIDVRAVDLYVATGAVAVKRQAEVMKTSGDSAECGVAAGGRRIGMALETLVEDFSTA